ncbi:SDR family NAD(P)-dependent oxidoreductase [Aquicoccus porphyridii]|uniref:SDR family NAD(P)-dependent oxidoreductase n=1 Tax=Aquicoccus porphyridii TaxID=1852029 RepID=UPI00273F0B09|nr:SDR family NAD(P)-dependent oxidoreductase [Aquicoccus porphyridii]
MAKAGPRKSVLITGGARGIGEGIVAALHPDHDLTVHYNRTRPDTDLIGQCAVFQGDLTDPSTPARAVEAAMARFGRLDAIVHNAGVIADSPLDSFDPDAYRAMFEVNLFAAQGLLAAARPHFGRGAVMVNISSVNAVLPPSGAPMYGASKAALELWTRGAAKELGPQGIRVNAIAPGAIDVAGAARDEALKQAFVEMTALGRMGTPQDIADAVCFLISDQAAFITGEVLTVSGGYRL